MAWVLSPGDVAVWQDAPVDELLDGESRPVRLPLTQSSQAMPLFSALTVESASCEVTADPAEPPQQYTFNVDTVLYAGGPVWSTAWCPLHNSEDATAGPLQTVETLAVSTHPRTQRRNPIGMQHTGPGLVQLWGVPSSAESQLLPGGLPQLLALLWHDGRVCWDLAWCPDPSAFIPPSSNSTGSSSSSSTGGMPAAQQAVPLQGLLAAVLGNGDVIVWAVPTIAYLLEVAEEAGVSAASAPQQQQQQQDLQQPVQPLSLQLTPLMQLPCSAVGGSMASCCSWLPATPHDQLLVGCWDGNVAIWQLPTTAGGSAQPIQLLRADPTPIHSVAWQPNKRWWLTGDTEKTAAAILDSQSCCSSRSTANGSGSSSSSSFGNAAQSCRYFLTASNIGNVRVWDAQDVLQPLHERVVSRNAINSALWMGPPHVFVVASADGMLRQIWLDAGAQATTITTQVADVSGSCGSIWSVAGSEVLSVVAYVSDGGLLGILPMEPPTGENRHRKSHAALSAVAVDDDQLWLLSAREVPGNGGLYENVPSWQNSNKKGKPAEPSSGSTVVLDPLPHPDQVLHSVSFSPNYRGSVSLAYGGGAGVVRVHTVSSEIVPTGM